MSTRAQLKLDDSFIDMIEQEYINASSTVDEEHAQLDHLNQFCPPVVNTFKMSLCTLHVKLLDRTGTLIDCKAKQKQYNTGADSRSTGEWIYRIANPEGHRIFISSLQHYSSDVPI